MEYKKYWKICLAGVLLAIAIGYGVHYLYSSNEKIVKSLGEELTIYRNTNGEQVARIQYLKHQDTRNFLALKTKDKEIIKLQEIVKEYKNELKKGGTVSKIKGTTKIDTVIRQVTVIGDSVFPIYSGTLNLGKWVTAKVQATKSEISLDMLTNNEYSVVNGSEKTGFLGLGKRQPFTDVINHNPYSETESIRTFEVTTEKERRLGVGIVIGYGLSSEDVSPRPMVGIGLSYQLFKF